MKSTSLFWYAGKIKRPMAFGAVSTAFLPFLLVLGGIAAVGFGKIQSDGHSRFGRMEETETPTAFLMATNTPTGSLMESPTESPSATSTEPDILPSATLTETRTATRTRTSTITPTRSVTRTRTSTTTKTRTPVITRTWTLTPSPTGADPATHTPTEGATDTPTASATGGMDATNTPTATVSQSPTTTWTRTRTRTTTGTPMIYTNTPTRTGAAEGGLLDNIDSISAGYAHACALTTAGGVLCWGDNWYGQLGDGTRADRSEPVLVSGLESGITAVASGYGHTCVITAGGGVKCWGYNRYGQLGNGTTVSSAFPVDVSGLTGNPVAIAAGNYFTCVVTSDGGAACWGMNTYGQLGDGTTTHRLTPVAVLGLVDPVQALSAGTGNHICALTAALGVKCWGWNSTGQLGNGTFMNSSLPVNVSGLAGGVLGLGAGTNHSCAVTTAGGAKCWGSNSSGQLGDGTRITRATPVNVSGLIAGVRALDGGTFHTCALLAGGGVKCWGHNLFGQLGNGTNTASQVPVDVIGLAEAIGSLDTGSNFACAVTAGGGVWCWGSNSNGSLGNGTFDDSSVPLAVVAPGT